MCKFSLIAIILLFTGSVTTLTAQSFYAVTGKGSATPVSVKSTNTTGKNTKGKASRKKSRLTTITPSGETVILDPEPIPPPVKTNFVSKRSAMPDYLPVDSYYGFYKIDCVWVKKYDYFKVWENNKLNPYDFDGEDLKDSVQLKLFDQNDSLVWHAPLNKMIVTSDFGLRRASWHYGVDLRARVGSPVYAAFKGIVRILGYERHGFGRFIVIRHSNGLETVYAHLIRTHVELGEVVKAGQVIGNTGSSGRSTGPHLHFEVRYSGNAIDPNQIFNFRNDNIRSADFTVTPGTFAYLEEAKKIRYHVVRRGDTLSGIGYRFGVPVSKLCHLNHMRRSSLLHIGQRIRIN